MDIQSTSSDSTMSYQQQQQKRTAILIVEPPMQPPLNLPRSDLITGSREDYIEIGVPLYEASIKGDWTTAEAILFRQPELVRFAITENYETPLHIAASAESTKSVEEFVQNLVNMMEAKDLELQNKSYNTAFYLAAAAENLETARIMASKNPLVFEIPGSQRLMPLYVAALHAKPKMVRYLYTISNRMSSDYWNIENRGWVLQKCVDAEIFDVALQIVNDRPELCAKNNLLTDVLLLLAKKTHAFKHRKPHIVLRIINSSFAVFHVHGGHAEEESDAHQLLSELWRRIVIMPKKEIDAIIRGPPSEVKRKEAIKGRHANIYNLLYEIGSMKDMITPIKDKNGNNMLHLVSKSAKPKRLQDVSGIALQMQRELLWFNEVERMIPPSFRKCKNNDGEEPYDLFTIKHEKLVKKGENWMKNTASQCMVVATLIATIVFAAAFTLPGGYNQDTGIPFFQQKPTFIIFVIADAFSLVFSSTSVLVFLSILTSRYVERDFLELLPKKLMAGLATLFLSIVSMMIAFGASFFLLYKEHFRWVPIILSNLVALPVILFAILQFRLLGDVYHSVYESRHLFKPKKRMLYY
ncbi:unnamed protein product [Lactuca virosa]|uniref:PGG domain-containing protein n=1 Tax=Lactuca virosa TaxID=75947 RepID=A0AAU9PVP6_9ASTR|nr:unnamed protein product [Lactuca virosa]